MNVGPWELVVILIIGILVIGPQRMVELARTIGRVTSQLQRFSHEFISTLQSEVLNAERDSLHSPEQTVADGKEAVATIQAELQTVGRETRQALESIVKGSTEPGASIQAELQTVECETRQALEDMGKDEMEQEAG